MLGGEGGGQPDFFRCRFWEFQEGIGKNRHKSEKTKNYPISIIPAVVCSYTLKCYIFITLIYY